MQLYDRSINQYDTTYTILNIVHIGGAGMVWYTGIIGGVYCWLYTCDVLFSNIGN